MENLQYAISETGGYSSHWMHHPEWSSSALQVYEGLQNGEGDMKTIATMRRSSLFRERIKHYAEISQAYGDEAHAAVHSHEGEADLEERKYK